MQSPDQIVIQENLTLHEQGPCVTHIRDLSFSVWVPLEDKRRFPPRIYYEQQMKRELQGIHLVVYYESIKRDLNKRLI